MVKDKINQHLQWLKGENLTARCARNSVVLGIAGILSKAVSFASKAILAKLLFDKEMGLMVLLLSITAFFEMMAEMGIKQSVIQNKKGDTQTYLNMAWWFQAVRAVALYLIAWFATPIMCRFFLFDKPELLEMYSKAQLMLFVRLTFLTILFNGLISPRAHLLTRNFKFLKRTILFQGSTILGTALTIILAFYLRNVRAFIFGTLSTSIFAFVFSFVMCPFLPRLRFDRDSFGELARFARGMWGLPILTYFAFNIDVLIGGKTIDVGVLGMYGLALALARLPRELIERTFGPLLLPAFSEKQDDKAALCKALLRISKSISLLTAPLVMVAALCGSTILTYVYTPEYAQVSDAFALQCVYYFILLQAFPLGRIFFGLGQPHKHRLFVAVRTILLVSLMYPAALHFGTVGMAGLLACANLVALTLQLFMLKRAIGLNIRHYVISWMPGLALAIVPGIGILILKQFEHRLALLPLLGGLVISGIGFLVCMLMFRKIESFCFKAPNNSMNPTESEQVS